MAKKFRKTQKKNVKEQAMDQMRKTRAQIEEQHPELLNTIREHLQKSEAHQQEQAQKAKKMRDDIFDNEMVTIDKAKNLETVLKYMVMNPNNTRLKAELKDYLQ